MKAERVLRPSGVVSSIVSNILRLKAVPKPGFGIDPASDLSSVLVTALSLEPIAKLAMGYESFNKFYAIINYNFHENYRCLAEITIKLHFQINTETLWYVYLLH